MTRARALAPLAAIVLGIAVAGCGSDEETSTAGAEPASEPAAATTPEATVELFVGALREGDASTACAQLGAETLRDLEVAGSCEKVLGDGLALIDEKQVEFPAYEIGDVRVDGRTAEATLNSAATEDVVHLVREGGEWKLAGTTTLEQIHPASPLTSDSGEGEVGG